MNNDKPIKWEHRENPSLIFSQAKDLVNTSTDKVIVSKMLEAISKNEMLSKYAAAFYLKYRIEVDSGMVLFLLAMTEIELIITEKSKRKKFKKRMIKSMQSNCMADMEKSLSWSADVIGADALLAVISNCRNILDKVKRDNIAATELKLKLSNNAAVLQ